jgi:flagellin-like protein
MKGISAIIASILLLLVAIAIIGFAFTFFQRITATSGAQTEQQLNSTATQIQTALKIDSASANSLTIRNIGSATISTAAVGVYVNNVPQSCSWSIGSLQPGAIATCTSGFSCTTGQQVRVTSASVVDAVACP